MMPRHDPGDVLRVGRLDAADRAAVARWNDFVMAMPQATFFHRAEWQGLINQVFRHDTWFLYAERGGALAGILPLAHVNSRLFGNALVALPFAVYGGIVASDPAAAAALEARAEELGRELAVDHIEYRNMAPRHADWPHQDLYVTFRKEILPADDANLNAIPRKQRAMVRKGIKRGLRAAVDDDIERFYALFADNVHRHGTPALPRRWFAALQETFGDACQVLTVTDTAGTPVSSVLSFYFRDEVLPYYAGDAVAARALAANDFKYWALMCHARERGCKVFDYGRSKIGAGSYAFKRNWGFEPTPLSYEYRLLRRDKIPQNNPNNPKYRLLIATWRRLPLWLANRLGPLIVRNLG